MTYYIRLNDKQFPFHIGDIEIFMRNYGGIKNMNIYFSPVEITIPPTADNLKLVQPSNPIFMDGKWILTWNIVDKPQHIIDIEQENIRKEEQEPGYALGLMASGSVPDVID